MNCFPTHGYGCIFHQYYGLRHHIALHHPFFIVEYFSHSFSKSPTASTRHSRNHSKWLPVNL
jgi:hypothetical protein